MFILNGIGAAAVALGIYLHYGWAWALGAFIATLSIISYIISRTVGLPATHVEEWEALGIASMVVEAAFLGVYAMTLRNRTVN